MAKAAKTESAWTLDDLPRLASELEAVGAALQKLGSFTDSFESRLIQIEKEMVKIDTGERMLPSEVIADLSPGRIFQTALQAVIIGNIMANPNLFVANAGEKARSAAADRMLDAATTILNQACARVPQSRKKAS